MLKLLRKMCLVIQELWLLVLVVTLSNRYAGYKHPQSKHERGLVLRPKYIFKTYLTFNFDPKVIVLIWNVVIIYTQ